MLDSLIASEASMDEGELQVGIKLHCPRCKNDLAGFDCAKCGLRMPVDHGIVHALPPERGAYFERFIEDYEQIRAAEGRGSESSAFYLNLPYRDICGGQNNRWYIRARSYDCLIHHVLDPRRHKGVLDLGAGNCWMSYRLALLGYSPIAVDLLTNVADGLGAAAHYQCVLPQLFPRFQAEFSSLPFQSAQFDAVIFNASFHYSENYESSLREALRCLRPGGTVVISDTAWYSREESGQSMVSERQAAFRESYGTTSDSIQNLEFLTDECLRALEERLSIRWTVFSPRYGFKWAMRPWLARLRGRREPSQFRIYSAQKDA